MFVKGGRTTSQLVIAKALNQRDWPTILGTGGAKTTLIDFYDTSEEALIRAGHTGGVQCRCKECNNLLGVENKNILKLGTFYEHGLNSRDEIKSLCRCKW